MKILLCGDVSGRSGREVLQQNIKKYRSLVDFIVVNVDNAAHGFGITPTMVRDILSWGADALTGGNHLTDQKEIFPILTSEKRLIKPANTSDKIPGSGILETQLFDGRKVVVIHLLGQKNMPMIGDNPFIYMREILNKYKLGVNASAIIVDFHAEVSSEKVALGHFLDGKVSAVVGTHTHIPTADWRILEHGTAYQTDLGMIGDYDSVIGMKKDVCVERFISGYASGHLTPAMGKGTFFGLLVELNDKTGLAINMNFVKHESL
ncbi:MAG: YmdB family metallophosphoesterase [Alphaproteobacteria bacterium]|nr:YmdB family metallophosphoesterase [Alphaproteobacteria bacterium]